MIVFLVAATQEAGIADGAARYWTRIAYNRFVTPDKTDVRLITRYADLHPASDKTRMVKGSDYEDGPAINESASPSFAERQMNDWLKEKAAFDEFVTNGHGEWVAL